jgi:hypothetical protein
MPCRDLLRLAVPRQNHGEQKDAKKSNRPIPQKPSSRIFSPEQNHLSSPERAYRAMLGQHFNLRTPS